MPADVIADLTLAAEPQMNVNAVASTTAVVLASIVLREVAGAVPAFRVTPISEARMMPLALMAVDTSPAGPVRVMTVVAVIAPLVFASRLISLAAVSVVSLRARSPEMEAKMSAVADDSSTGGPAMTERISPEAKVFANTAALIPA
jgi:hypothetical protein